MTVGPRGTLPGGPTRRSHSWQRVTRICENRVMTRAFGVLLLVLTLISCGSREQAKRYPMEGDIKALDTTSKTASIAAGQIGDWMGPMTMEYLVKPDSEFQKLHVGDHIEATVVVNDLAYYVTDIKVIP